MKAARFFSVVVLLSGCQLIANLTDRSAGGSCVLNSDCASTHHCLFRVCSEKCREDRDCDRGSRCLSLDGVAACVSPPQAQCDDPSDCPPGANCIEDECRTECDPTASDQCREDQTCSPEGACIGNDPNHDLPGGGEGGGGGSGGAGGASGGKGGSGGTSGGAGGNGGAGGASGGSGGAGGSTGGSGGSGGSTGGDGGTGGGSGDSGSGNTAGNGGSGNESGTGGSGGDSGMSGTGGATGGSGGTGGNTGGDGGMGNMSGTGGSSGSAGSSVVDPPPDITSGTTGVAYRYWNCCKPTCGWTANVDPPVETCSSLNVPVDPNAQSSCGGAGTAYMCWDMTPWEVGPELSYGFAAGSGTSYACGQCFHLYFTNTAVSDKHMIVQIVDNGGSTDAGQFDLLIPGGGLGSIQSCSTQFGVATSEWGDQFGGFASNCGFNAPCIQERCNTIFSDVPQMLAGCNWFIDWFEVADNPQLRFEEIACPAELLARSGLQDPG